MYLFRLKKSLQRLTRLDCKQLVRCYRKKVIEMEEKVGRKQVFFWDKLNLETWIVEMRSHFDFQ